MTKNLTPRSLRALLSRLIDYAGLFPPAKLDMAATVRNYSGYLQSDEGWMLGRLIVPVAQLAEFDEHAAEFLPNAATDDPNVWTLSALTSPADSDELAAELAAIEDFNLRHEDQGAGRAIIDVVELKLESAKAIDGVLGMISDDLFPFFEVSIGSDPGAMVGMLSECRAGAKVRTGGTTAEAYPSPANLARFIAACATVNVPIKATAGMHHPLRRFNAAVQAEEFGFLNVFIAACLALTQDLSPALLEGVLGEQSIAAFAIDDDGIAWREHRVEAASIEDVRAEFAMSFGSCSFDEPREDLKTLSIL